MSINCRAIWTVGFLASALLAPAAVQAQGQGRGQGMGGGGGMAGPGIISVPAVQKELKLSEEQASKAATFAEEYREKGREMYAELEGLEQAERQTKMQALNQKHFAAGMKDVEAMLKPEQTKRFKQIVFQTRGIDNLTDPETAKALKVTPEQADRVKNLLETQRSEMREATADAGSDRRAAMGKMQEIRKATLEKALAKMTPEQKTMYKEMAGEPFEMPAMGGRGGR